MASKIDLEGKRGDTWYWQFEVLQSDEETVQDITGAQFRFTVKADIDDGDGDAVVVGTTGTGECQVTDAVNGIVKVKIPPADTDVAAPATFDYDLQARDAAGDVWTVAAGKLRVTKDVSVTAP